MALKGLFKRVRTPGDLVGDNSDEPRLDHHSAAALLGPDPDAERIDSVLCLVRRSERHRVLDLFPPREAA